jgi:hypothetical protein
MEHARAATALTHPATHPHELGRPHLATGDKAKARDILSAIRTLTRLESEHRPAIPEERQALARFPGFGPVALLLFPDPVTGRYRDESWRMLSEELRALLSPEEYDSA